MKLITTIYNLLWGDLITIPLPGGGSLGLSLLVLLLIPAGIFFTARTRFLPVRLFPEMLKTAMEKRSSSQKNSISGFQTLIIATATRVGMGNLVGVVAAISAGIVHDQLLLDLCYEEDSSAQVDLNCVMTGEGGIVELQGTGEGRAFTVQEQRDLVDLCAKGIREVMTFQAKALEG